VNADGCPGLDLEIAEAMLGLQEAAEAERVARHLDACAACRMVAGRWQEVLMQLSEEAPPVEPSPRARRALSAWLSRETRRRRLTRRAAVAASVAAALAVGFAGRAALAPGRPATPGMAALARLLAEPGLHVVPLQGEGRATLVMRPGSMAVLAVANLPVLPDNFVYQVWWLRNDRWVSAGVFERSKGGVAMVHLTPTTREDRVVWVTRERAPGALKPSSGGLLWAPLNEAAST
jgi:anti-sigma-K factor RskA